MTLHKEICLAHQISFIEVICLPSAFHPAQINTTKQIIQNVRSTSCPLLTLTTVVDRFQAPKHAQATADSSHFLKHSDYYQKKWCENCMLLNDWLRARSINCSLSSAIHQKNTIHEKNIARMTKTPYNNAPQLLSWHGLEPIHATMCRHWMQCWWRTGILQNASLWLLSWEKHCKDDRDYLQ